MNSVHPNENQCTTIPLNKAADKPLSLTWSSQPHLTHISVHLREHRLIGSFWKWENIQRSPRLVKITKPGSKFTKFGLKLKASEMFCSDMSLPKKADVRNSSQLWVKISRLRERGKERWRYVFLTKSHWLSALNSICPGCVRQEGWGWAPGATGKCLAKIPLAALGWIFLHTLSLMFPKGSVLLLYEKKSKFQI